MNIQFETIGNIYTPYIPSLPIPHQPQKDAPGEFWISVHPKYLSALKDLVKFRYIYVLYHLDQITDTAQMTVTPPEVPGLQVGLFASRSPLRPNPIGLSVVEVKEVAGNEIVISGIDVYNGTPLLDIKPFFRSLDNKPDANDGWYDDLVDREHILAHLLNQAHEHGHGHEHEHEHEHAHHDHPHSPSTPNHKVVLTRNNRLKHKKAP